ncbi:hypothetical protein [Kribbella sp. CA-294648]|uniref:hypothetical protein n=1 Tax=Kribbella sp. CA-294648 TaxID=3239948 RepID=UPI003D8E4967
MTSHEDPTETLLTQSLDRRAAEAPRDDDLLDQVHTRLRRRRSARTAGSLVLACAAVVTGIFGVHSMLDTTSSTPPATQISPGPTTPAEGWRWESYRTIQLQVPSDWGFGTTDQPPCLVKKKVAGYVGRPGFVPGIGCMEAWPEPRVRSPYVWFASGRAGVQTSGDGWTQETRELDGVTITVFSSDDALRKRIFDSVAPIVSVDGNGCPPVVPVDRPGPGAALESVGTIRSIAVCGFIGNVLNSSSKLGADQSKAIASAILAAPKGVGPDQPKCYDSSPIDLLLKVDGTTHDAELTIRFSNCTHNGADDGTTIRRLTKPYLDPLLTGPHQLPGWSSKSGIGILRDQPRTK